MKGSIQKDKEEQAGARSHSLEKSIASHGCTQGRGARGTLILAKLP